jgi:glucosamine kinase
MQLFLGIDGGGTGCRAAVVDAAGRVLGRGAGGPANISVETDAALASILEATRAALLEAGQCDADLGQMNAALGLAGANVPEAAARLATALPFAQSRIVSDSMTATIGALRGEDGIVAAMGTGSVFGVARNGAFRSYGGHGFVLGDEGSGAVLGRALLSEALRATDGFVPMTPLLQQVLEELGGPAGVIAFSLAARPADFARYAPRILAGGDPAAESLFDASLLQVAGMIDHLQGDAPVPVVFLGGLGEAYAARLAGRWNIRPAKGTGLDGAVLLAIGEA